MPQAEISRDCIDSGLDIVAALVEKSGFLKSNGEARRALEQQSVYINKTKVDVGYVIQSKDLIDNQFVLLQRGKKNYCILKVSQ